MFPVTLPSAMETLTSPSTIASTSKEKVVPSPPLKLVITALLRTISSCVKPVTDSPKVTSMLNPSLEVA